MTEEQPRVLPHSIHAEESLISCCLIDGPDSISKAVTLGVKVTSFYSAANRLVWERILAMLAAGKPIALEILAEELRTAKQLDEIGGYAFLMQVSGRDTTTAQVVSHAETIVRFAALREIIRLGVGIVEQGYGYTGGDVAEQMGPYAMRLLSAVSGSEINPEKNWDQLVDKASEIADSIIANKGKPSSMVVNWPWREMDELFQPMERGQLVILAARSSIGKSSLARPMAIHSAKNAGSVYFVTLEVNPEKVPLQLAASASGIGINALGRVHAVDQSAFKQSLVKLKGIGVTVARKDRSLAHIISRARALHSQNPLSMLVIDHGGQISDIYNARPSDKVAVISQVTKTLKTLAGELNCVVVLLWQLNRSSAKEGNREPQSHDLRDCGSLEEDADKVILIHRPSENPITGQAQADNDLVRDRPTFFQNVIQSKGRDDGGSIVSFNFKRETATFIPISKAQNASANL